jgi:hypothetical protein
MRKILFFLMLSISAYAQDGKFEQLGTTLPTPNSYRTASGAPGHEYYQQRADYVMKVELNDENQSMTGEETITYFNNSPDKLSYLWLQLDQNIWKKDSDTKLTSTAKMQDRVPLSRVVSEENPFDGGYTIGYVKDAMGKDLKYTINKTMMRVDLPMAIGKGQTFTFKIAWSFPINDRMSVGGRSGYEYFAKDDNYLYTIAQFFPRLCAYDDVNGWQNKQFLGTGEFTLIFGNYMVDITVPEDHLVAASGTLQNMSQVMTKDQLSRYEKSKKEFEQPVIVATQAEALEREKTKKKGKKTWKFKADNVRDFAFASSRKFIWDAMAVKQEDGTTVMAMSMYPKEGNPLWEKYSTKAVAHTLKWFSNYTFAYPYPVAWSISADRIGMEYPMICFNGGRCQEDGTYTERDKYGMIGVIIHEVGHNYFPMIVNSDERQWSWMDEGLNTFLQYLTEQQWERNYPSRRGPAPFIVPHMSTPADDQTPIMVNSENAKQFGNNAYAKPATALNILRETILGRELFDYSFKEYANRWKFKSPMPADFFRTMEDASAVDLDWFWKGWFFTTDPVDIAVSEVKTYKVNPTDPTKKYEIVKAERAAKEEFIGDIRNREEIKQTYSEIDTTILDFYNRYDRDKPDQIDMTNYEKMISRMTPEEKKALETDNFYYELSFENKGGLVMPVILQFKYADGTDEYIKLPAEIWRYNENKISKVFTRSKEVTEIVLDPYLETADIDRTNNYYPPRKVQSKFELFKASNPQAAQPNPMQRANTITRP